MPPLATLNKNSAPIYPIIQPLHPILSHHNAFYFILFVHDLFQRRGYWVGSAIRFCSSATPTPIILWTGVDNVVSCRWVDKFNGMYYRSGMDDISSLDLLPEEVLKEILLLEEQKKRLETRDIAKDKFMAYAKHVYDGFIEGTHHRVIAEKLERIASGDLKRLIVNMPPRHSKSEFASYLMPSWFLGRNPKLKIIQATMNTELAVGLVVR